MIPDNPTGGHAPAAPTSTRRPFGHLTIGDTTVSLELADRQPNGRGYFLDDDEPAVVVGPGADPQTVANAIASMVMLLGLAAPAAAR